MKNFAGFFLVCCGNLSATGPVTDSGAGALSNLEAVMITRKQIDHAELLQLGKMLLLVTERQQTWADFASLIEPNKRVSEIKTSLEHPDHFNSNPRTIHALSIAAHDAALDVAGDQSGARPTPARIAGFHGVPSMSVERHRDLSGTL
jgi:hypothetical protein